MKEFTIDRATWLHGDIQRMFGTTTEGSCLLDGDGNRCCLGFYLKACGVSDRKMLLELGPADVENIPKQARWLTRGDTELTESKIGCQLIRVNDSKKLHPATRERKIKELFASQGVTLKFEGRSPRKQ